MSYNLSWRLDAERKYLKHGLCVERYESRKEHHGVGDTPVETKYCYMFPYNNWFRTRAKKPGWRFEQPRAAFIAKPVHHGTGEGHEEPHVLPLVFPLNSVLQSRTDCCALTLATWPRSWKEGPSCPQASDGVVKNGWEHSQAGRHCNSMPDAPQAPIQLNEKVNGKERWSWADWTEDMDKTSDTSSIHSERTDKQGFTTSMKNTKLLSHKHVT